MKLFFNVIGLICVIIGITIVAYHNFKVPASGTNPLEKMPIISTNYVCEEVGGALFLIGTILVLIARNRAKQS